VDFLLDNHRLVCVLLGFIVDCVIGDPPRLPHPVRAIGLLVSFLERKLHPAVKAMHRSKRNLRIRGGLLVLCTVCAAGGVAYFFTAYCYALHPAAGLAAETVLCAWSLAARNLRDCAMDVYRALAAGDMEQSRKAVSMIVGRDVAVLDADGIARAAVETVAENTNDGVIAPLFYLLLGGPAAAMVYKAVNTMDSMIGYKNDRYRYFGTAAARLDDVMGFIPARITAACMIAGSFFLRLNWRDALRIFIRDRGKHQSPNAGQAESACAGALGIRLAGDAWYAGVLEHKPYIGDNIRSIEPADIKCACALLYACVLLCIIPAAVLLLVRFWL